MIRSRSASSLYILHRGTTTSDNIIMNIIDNASKLGYAAPELPRINKQTTADFQGLSISYPPEHETSTRALVPMTPDPSTFNDRSAWTLFSTQMSCPSHLVIIVDQQSLKRLPAPPEISDHALPASQRPRDLQVYCPIRTARSFKILQLVGPGTPTLE